MKLSAPMVPCMLSEGENGGKMLVIPIYQRLFVWREEQIDKLLQDLWNACRQDKEKDYHLGVITVHQDKEQRWEVVDGQQRLTFLTLLGCSLICARLCGRARWNAFVWLDEAQKQPRLFFNGREEERKDIPRMAGYPSDGKIEVENASFSRFADCFRRFAEKMPAEEMVVFSVYCFEHAAFLVNELPRQYEAEELNLHFEKMNSTGRQLSPLEVVKGKWFSPLAARWNRCMNFDEQFTGGPLEGDKEGEKTTLNLHDVLADNDKYKRVWNMGKATDQAMPPKSRLIMRPEILALHALCCLYKTKGLPLPFIQRHKLIETFQLAFDGEKLSPDDYLAELEVYRRWVDANIVYLQELEMELEYAFREKASGGTEDERKRMKQFQTMLHVSSGEAQDWVLNAYFLSKGGELTYQALRQMDCGWHSEAPDESSLRYGRISRYWFWKLDYLLWELHEDDKANACFFGWEQREHDAVHEYRFRDNRSIEHLWPQSQGGASSPWGSRDDPNAAMHRFGNLAMMSVEGNSSQQDDPLQVKFGRVKAWLESGRLESIKMLLMFHLADKEPKGWTPQVAEQHEKEMIALLEEDRKKWGG